MQTHYETVFIVNPDVGAEIIKDVVSKAKAVVEKNAAKDIAVDEWGRRKLAYAIAKKQEGHYVVVAYTSEPVASKELDLFLKYREDVIRYQTVTLKERKAPKAAEAAPAAPAAEGGNANG